MAKFCTNCGAKLEDNVAFCTSCGAKLEAAPAQPAKTVQQTQPAQPAQPAPQQRPQQQQQYAPQQQYTQQPQPQYAQQQYAPQPQYAQPQQQYAPQPQYAGAPAPVPKKKSHGCLITILIFVLIIALLFTGFVKPGFVPKLIQSNKPLPAYFTNGSKLSAALSEEEPTTIGSTKENGVSLKVANDSFAPGTSVSMEVLPYEEGKKIANKAGFTSVGSVIRVTPDNYDGGYLSDVELTVEIPERFRGDDEKQFFMAVQNHKGEWEYYAPDFIHLKAGVAKFTVPHFSDSSLAKLPKSEAIDKYLDRYCNTAAMRKEDSENLTKLLGPDLEDALQGMGVPKENLGDVTAGIVSTILSKGEGKLIDVAGVDTNV